MANLYSTIEPLEARIAPATFTVTTLADSGPGSLRDALTQANTHASSGDTIVFDHVVGGKTVPLTGTIKLLSSLPDITDGVTIIGSTPASPKGITINLNKHAGFHIGVTSGDAGFKDLTITNGMTPYQGGGLYISDAGHHITISGCAITDNHALPKPGPNNGASTSGGGIFCIGGDLTVTNSKITGNTAVGTNGDAGLSSPGSAGGGGLYCTTESVTITNTVISGNTVTGGNAAGAQGDGGGSASGGGIMANSASTHLTITHSVISGNIANGGKAAPGSAGAAGTSGTAGANNGQGGDGGQGGNTNGGGLDLENSTTTISSTTISGNILHSGDAGAGGAGGKGGAGGGIGGSGGAGGATGSKDGAGIECFSPVLSISDSAIIGNFSTNGKAGAAGKGGAAQSFTQEGVIHRGAVGLKGAAGFHYPSVGGGIDMERSSAGTPKLSQVTIAENAADYDGGAFIRDGANISNCTIAGNKATIDCGGLSVGSSGAVTVISTIIARNTAPSDADVQGTIDGSYDLIGQVIPGLVFRTDTNNLKGTPQAPLNPLLGPLGLHDGGSTPTMLLSFLSPAISTGSNPDALTTDANGNVRVIGAAIDIGAVEEA